MKTTITSITKKQTLAQEYDLLGCMQCGKCTAACPVAMRSHLNIRKLMQEALTHESLNPIPMKELWDCTCCSTCTIYCPRELKPNELIINLRGILVEEGHVPTTIRDALESVFKQGNPWGGAKNKRAEWATDLHLKDATRDKEIEVVYFVGCTPSYDPRVQEVARALVKSFNKAGVNFGILGNEERCCGNEVRRMGEEGLFEILIEDNTNVFQKLDVKTMVTTSPHCYNTFKNEYPETHFEIQHYTQYVANLIATGKLTFCGEVDKVVTYHDPCFLGKQNKVFDAPRSIIDSIPGVKFIEFDRSRERSLCCEGGGGRMWVDASDSGERLAEVRVRDAVEMGVQIILTACPFCLLNLEDATKTIGYEDKIQVMDIMELVSQVI